MERCVILPARPSQGGGPTFVSLPRPPLDAQQKERHGGQGTGFEHSSPEPSPSSPEAPLAALHLGALVVSRRRRNYTVASKVQTRDASTGELLAVTPAYDPAIAGAIIRGGNAKSDATSRAKKRRNHSGRGA